MARKGKVLCKWDKDILKAWNILHGNKKCNKFGKVEIPFPFYYGQDEDAQYVIWAVFTFKMKGLSQKPDIVGYNFEDMARALNKSKAGGTLTVKQIATTLEGKILNSRLSHDGEFLIVTNPTYATGEWNGVSPAANALEGVGQNLEEFYRHKHLNLDMVGFRYPHSRDWVPAYEYVLKHRKKTSLVLMIIGFVLAVPGFVLAILPGTVGFIGFIIMIFGLLLGVYHLPRWLNAMKRIKNFETDVAKTLDD